MDAETSREVSLFRTANKMKKSSPTPAPVAKAIVRKPRIRVRLADVAKMAKVSRTVVGQVLNGGAGNSRVGEETAKRIKQIAQQMEYRPNPASLQLLGKRSHTYGVLVASAGDPLRSFLVQYLDTEAVKVGCHTIIGNTMGRNEPSQFSYYIDEFAHRGVDGVFCTVHDWLEGDRKALVEQHPNTVFYNDPGIEGACYVEVDRKEAVRLAVRHLVERGRKRIGIALTNLSKPTSRARMQGYEEELPAHNLALDEALVFNAAKYDPANSADPIHPEHNAEKLLWEYPSGVVDQSIDDLVRDARADAIIAHDDFWAATLLKRLRSRGISVPRDVAVVGYLNHYLTDWTDPPLTTIDLLHESAAKQMISMMERQISEGSLSDNQRVVTIQPRLIVREST